MNSDHRLDHLSRHAEFVELMPWYVNSTLADRDRQRLEAHLQDCAQCREELIAERHIHDAVAVDSGIEFMPSASLKRLQMRLDAGTGPVPKDATPARWAERLSRRGLIAAALAVIALAVGLLAADLRRRSPEHAAADYFTVTTPAPRVRGEVIRAVFAPTITLVEMQSLLDEAHLRIVAGPSEAGVYSLAVDSQQPVAASLQLLRKHDTVRFAESTESIQSPP